MINVILVIRTNIRISIKLFKGCRRCRRPRKGAAAAQGQIEGSSREYCNTLDFCQVGSKARGSSPFHNLFEAGWCLGAGQGLGGGGPRASVPGGQGGGARARGGGCKGFGSGGVGGRGTGPRDGANFATCVSYFCCF